MMAKNIGVDDLKTFLGNENLDSGFGQNSSMKVCPRFIICSHDTCRYHKPRFTSYRIIFCYTTWIIGVNGSQLRGGMAVPENRIPTDEDIANGELIDLAEVDT